MVEYVLVGVVVSAASVFVARTVSAPFRRSRAAGCGCGAACIRATRSVRGLRGATPRARLRVGG
jgi:hypothetical protein